MYPKPKSTSLVVETSTPSQQRIESDQSHVLISSELSESESERTPSMDTNVDKPERRGAIIISRIRSSTTMSDSLLKKLANIEITPKKRKSVAPCRSLLKKRAHSRRKNRVIIVDNKAMNTPSRESSSCCVQVESQAPIDGVRQGYDSG